MKDILKMMRRGSAPTIPNAVVRTSRHAEAVGDAPARADAKEDPASYVGYVDKVGVASVIGWAARRGAKSAIEVELYLDGELAAKFVAAEYRQDVADAGFGDGMHGFDLPVPKRQLLAARKIEIRSMVEGRSEVIGSTVLAEQTDRPPVVFLDASDLLEFLTYHREVSGIQRVQAGYLLGLADERIEGYEFRVCARFRDNLHYMEVPFAGLARLLREAGDSHIVTNENWRDHVETFRRALPKRIALIEGDVLFTMGAPWATENHNEAVRSAVRASKAFYFQIFYDLIPITMPEVVAVDLIPIFSRAMAAMVTYCDHVFSISEFSKIDLERASRKIGRSPPAISLIPMGSTIDDAGRRDQQAASATPLLVEGEFVLCVGTIEPRKNHALLYQVWKRLLVEHDAASVPKLVLVGRIGWYMEDFMRILKSSDNLDGKIILLQNISNDELGRLYDACLFTAFPSIYEGWGLPIVESMVRGRVCVCSNVTSMPEAGGECAVYIDPFSISDAYKTFETLLYDRDALRRREEKVRTDFRSQTWGEAARDFRLALGEALRQAASRRASLPFHGGTLVELGRRYNLGQNSERYGALRTFEEGIRNEEALDVLAGRAWFDPDVHCSWACGPKARLRLALPAGAKGRLMVYCEVMTPPTYLNRRCDISLDGQGVGVFTLADGSPRRLAITVDIGAASDQPREHELTFDYGEVRFPPLGAPDKRLLGLGLSWVAILLADDLSGRLAILEEGYRHVGEAQAKTSRSNAHA